MSVSIIIVPGWRDSGPGHWQSLWADSLPGAQRVVQDDWVSPNRQAWVGALAQLILQVPGPVVVVAHSLGCMTVAHLPPVASARIQGALLVAPGDPEREELRPVLKSWAPAHMQTLPFKTVLLGSHDDPYCSFERAQRFAQAWGSEFLDYGSRGHINADSGLGDWPEGHAMLQSLR